MAPQPPKPRKPRKAPKPRSVAQILARHARARVGLIRARELIGMTRPELASRLGVHRITIWRIEMGGTSPQIEFMVNWIEQLGPYATLDLFKRPPAPAPASKAA